MSGHTKGPWVASENSCYWEISSPGHAFEGDIASVCPSKFAHPDSDAANARLIAAAPEMLEALEAQHEAEEWIGDNDESDPFFEATYRNKLTHARGLRIAAIAKATGKEGK